MLRHPLLLSALALAPMLPAQTQYGWPTPGTGGIGPTLSCQQPWLGRQGFSVTVEQGLGGAPAVFVAAQHPVIANVLGMTVLVDPGAVLASSLVLLGGTAGAAGEGTGSMPVGLAGLPATPALAGSSFYFQAFVLDPNGPGLGGVLSASNGLDVSLTMPPELFVAVGNEQFRIDPTSAATPAPTSQPGLTVVNGIQYSRDGLDLFVVNGFGDVFHADLRGGAPSWTVAAGALGTSTAAWGNLAYLEDSKMGWVGGRGTGTEMELLLVSLDPASPSFGQILLHTTGLQTAIAPFGAWALSPDRTRIAAASPWNGSVAIVDVDTGSPTFLQILTVAAIPDSITAPGFTVNTYVAWHPDGSRFWISRQQQGTAAGEIACYDLGTGWVDHDPSTFFVDHIGPTSVPAVSLPAGLRCVAVSNDGEALFASGSAFGAGNASRVELATLQQTFATGPTYVTDEGLLSLDRDGARVAVSGDDVVVIYDTATMTELQAYPVGGGTTEKDMGWR